MDVFWHDLITNLAVVSALIACWALAQDWLYQRGRIFRKVAIGLAMGIAAMASMVFSIAMAPGVIFDMRAAPLAIAGLFGGVIGAPIAAVIAVAFRLALGGAGVWGGVLAIVFATGFGLVVNIAIGGRRPKPRHILIVSAAACTSSVLSSTLLGLLLPPVPIVILTLLATTGAGFAVYSGQRMAAERNLLRMALRQAPDFHYVKDVDSRFVQVNFAVARFNGFASPRDLIGKTDFELVGPSRAQVLFDAEQDVMKSGVPLLDAVEELVGADGVKRWFSTSKVPLVDADGRTMGLAGVTRDISEQRRTEAALADSKKLLNYAVEGMSDGLAMYDRNGDLVYCNDRYRAMFPLTAGARVPGANILDILRTVVDTGEQLELGDPEEWIRTIAGSLSKGGEEQVSLFDGRWLHIRTRPTDDGAAMVVVSDMTTLKKTEGELRTLTSELKVLAETDALTGQMNRRLMDIRIEEELVRGQAEQRPVSLIMFDVDHFKAYNDTLGHPAGDECLKVVARCIRTALLRPNDALARYGGEEFVAILPDTDAESAITVAERARTQLQDLGVPHPGSPFGHLSISAGVSTWTPGPVRLNASQLLTQADEALYEAKGAGRNRVMSRLPRGGAKAAS